MKRLRETLRLDVKLQARNKLYAIGIFVALLLGITLRELTSLQNVGQGLVAFYVLGLGGTTFMFAASMMLVEKSQHTLQALRVSMLRTETYVASKVVSLSLFAAVESAIVYAIAARGVHTQYLWLLVGFFVLGAFYTLVGLALVAPYRSVTKFLLPSGSFVAMILQLPVLSLVGIGPRWLWWLIPTQAPALLMQAAFEPLETSEWIYATTMSGCMLIAAWYFCIARCSQYTGLARRNA